MGWRNRGDRCGIHYAHTRRSAAVEANRRSGKEISPTETYRSPSSCAAGLRINGTQRRRRIRRLSGEIVEGVGACQGGTLPIWVRYRHSRQARGMGRSNRGDRGCIDHVHARRGTTRKYNGRTGDEIASAEAY